MILDCNKDLSLHSLVRYRELARLASLFKGLRATIANISKAKRCSLDGTSEGQKKASLAFYSCLQVSLFSFYSAVCISTRRPRSWLFPNYWFDCLLQYLVNLPSVSENCKAICQRFRRTLCNMVCHFAFLVKISCKTITKTSKEKERALCGLDVSDVINLLNINKSGSSDRVLTTHCPRKCVGTTHEGKWWGEGLVHCQKILLSGL